MGFERSVAVAAACKACSAHERVHRVSRSMRLNEALEKCLDAHVHMVIVHDCPVGTAPPARSPAVGIATFEDFIEEILMVEIVDEDDQLTDNGTSPSPALKSLALAARNASSRRRLPAAERINSRRHDTTALLTSLNTSLNDKLTA